MGQKNSFNQIALGLSFGAIHSGILSVIGAMSDIVVQIMLSDNPTDRSFKVIEFENFYPPITGIAVAVALLIIPNYINGSNRSYTNGYNAGALSVAALSLAGFSYSLYG